MGRQGDIPVCALFAVRREAAEQSTYPFKNAFYYLALTGMSFPHQFSTFDSWAAFWSALG